MENTKILITVKDFGEMTVELYHDKAPKTVDNFLGLVKRHFYEGLIFHRVIKGFMIQGGGFHPDFEHKDAPTIRGEFKSNGCKTNDIVHTRGVLSMARTSVPDSASSQFFIMHSDAPHLDGQYAAFGKVIEGLDVVDKIADVETGRSNQYTDVPCVPVVIEKMEVLNQPQ